MELQNRLVFIVEDNEMYSLMLEYKLSNDSVIKCMCFKSGEECLENLDLDPLLIILDYWLPGINGKETYWKIRKAKPNIPVVMLTRNKDKKLESELVEQGVKGYIAKEENSADQVRRIINTVIDDVINKEQKRVRWMKVIFILLMIAAVFITYAYLHIK